MSIRGTGSVTGVSVQYPEKTYVGTSSSSEHTLGLERKADIVVEKKYSKEDMERELEALNKWVQSRGTHIKFTLHEGLNEYYVQIINDQTNEVIREIPSRKIMDIAAKLQEMIGLLIDERR